MFDGKSCLVMGNIYSVIGFYSGFIVVLGKTKTGDRNWLWCRDIHCNCLICKKRLRL